MDKHLHKDIGEQFSEEINSLSQQPREHVWENIDKALDKTDAKNYKDKFVRLKKRTMLLLLLLIGISTFSVFYFNASKDKNSQQNAVHHYNLANQKTKKETNGNTTGNTDIIKADITLNTNLRQKKVAMKNTSRYNTLTNIEDILFIDKKLFINQKGETKIKITNATLQEETANAVEPESNINIIAKKINDPGVLKVFVKPGDADNNITKTTPVLKKDTVSVTTDNRSSKKRNKKQRIINPRFTLTAFAAPDYSKYRLTNGKHNNYDNKADITTRERSDLSSSFGVLFGYKVGNKITIQSGVIYSSTNISIAPTKIYAEKDNTGAIKFRYNTSSGYGYLLPSFSNAPAVGDSLFADGANHTLRYISMPIIAKYKLGNKKITFNPGVGVTFDFLTKATLTTDLVDQLNRETEYTSKIESIKKITYSLMFTPEVQYQLSKNWSISALPFFKYSLVPINKGNIVKTYPYSFGLGIGAVYKF